MNYSEKLKDPRWQRKRLEILKRDNFTCQYCGETKQELNIHHFSYHAEPWDECSDNLITVCEHCHSIIEAYKKYPEKITGIYNYLRNGNQSFYCVKFKKGVKFVQRNKDLIIETLGMNIKTLKEINKFIDM